MADRNLDERDADNSDNTGRGESRPPIRSRRRIRVTENGMPDRPGSHEYSDYVAPASDAEDEDEIRDGLVKRPSRRREIHPQSADYAADDDGDFARPQAASSRRRMPQLPMHGGLSDLIGRGRLAMALLMGLLAFVGYNVSRRNTLANMPTNPVASQPINLLAEHDIALGQKSAHQILSRHGGISNDQDIRSIVQQVGARLVQSSEAGRSRYQFSFDVLADDTNIGAFALPGGRIYLTAALLDQLTSHGEIAGILAHEMAHVTQRHGVVRLANASLAGGITGAVVMASFIDPENYKPTDEDVTHLITETVQLRYDPSEVQTSDAWAVHYMAQAGFHPESLVSALRRVTQINGQPTSFAVRHQSPENQLALIQQQIRLRFPQGIPSSFIR